jgi:DNA-binding transcriptional LysR family regulator
MVGRGGHPLAQRTKVQMADLHTFPVANAAEVPVAGLTGEAGSFVCDNYHILRETVLGTDCVWLASPDLLVEDFEAGRLVTLDVSDFGPLQNDLSIIRRRGRTMSPAAEAVVGIVQTICSS